MFDEEDGDVDDEDDDEELEVIDCQDEEEFQPIIAKYVLQRAEILPSGNLRLPDGTEAAHRDLRYIYKQRGRTGAAVRAAAEGEGGVKALPMFNRRAMLMISNGAAGSMFAVSQRQRNRQEKQVMAVLRTQNKWQVQRELKQNILNKKRVAATRSVRGDASGSGTAGR